MQDRRGDDARYRDAREQAERCGDPQSWQVLQHAALASSASSSRPELGDDRRVRRTTSRNSLLTSPYINRGAPSTVSLTEEPESYAALGEDVEQPLPAQYGGPSALSASHSDTESDTDDEEEPVRRPVSSPESQRSGCFSRVFNTSLPLSAATKNTIKNVIKCVIAYGMAEMWTFVPVLTDVLGAPWDVDGPVKNAHVVATIAVYFNVSYAPVPSSMLAFELMRSLSGPARQNLRVHD